MNSLIVKCRYLIWAPSIFGASEFERWVVTHSLDDSNFHGHIAFVIIHPHPLWYRLIKILAPYLHVWFIPHYQFCLPEFGPLTKIYSILMLQLSKQKFQRQFKVRDVGDRINPPLLKNVALPPLTINFSLLSWETFRLKPATRRLDESFAALVKSSHQFAR